VNVVDATGLARISVMLKPVFDLLGGVQHAYIIVEDNDGTNKWFVAMRQPNPQIGILLRPPLEVIIGHYVYGTQDYPQHNWFFSDWRATRPVLQDNRPKEYWIEKFRAIGQKIKLLEIPYWDLPLTGGPTWCWDTPLNSNAVIYTLLEQAGLKPPDLYATFDAAPGWGLDILKWKAQAPGWGFDALKWNAQFHNRPFEPGLFIGFRTPVE
jgi:hypothetical protein